MFKKSKKVTLEPLLKKEVVRTENFTCLQYNGSNHEQILSFVSEHCKDLYESINCVVQDDFIIVYSKKGYLPKSVKKGEWVYIKYGLISTSEKYEDIC